jgi:hypothetical protein
MFPLAIVWLGIGLGNDLRNQEYGNIVTTIKNHEFQSSCKLKLDVDTEFPLGWSPSSFDVKLERDGKVVSTSTSKYFKPDRVERSPGEFYYMFKWSEMQEGRVIASYLEMEIERGDALKWIKVSACEVLEGDDYFYAKADFCVSEKRVVVQCS